VSRSDDLAPLLGPAPGGAVGFRQGVVLAWNQLTAENVVQVAGGVFTNLSILNTNEALLLGPGDVVGILTTGEGAQSWFVLGRVTVPATPQAATALKILSDRMLSVDVSAIETTTSATYTDLTTPGPILSGVRIGQSGKCLVIITAELWGGESGSFPSSPNVLMSFDTSGATTLGPSDGRVLSLHGSGLSADVISVRASAFVLMDGLNPGLHTFTAKYRQNSGFAGRTGEFGNRNLTAIPF
jgi:hypothetical protein